MRYFSALILFLCSIQLHAQQHITRFETSGGKQTPDYAEVMNWWKALDKASNIVQLKTMGMTDAGEPLSLIVVSTNRQFDLATLRRQNKRIILINNGIHPGEPDGIDASMLLVRDIVEKKISLPENIVLAIIPVYNIGGILNRSANYRVDQNGPEEFGFRGNSRNFDLNRDFIKADSREARSFAEIFHLCDPDVFVDNHVSNGADYQHVMTLIASQHNKLGGVMGRFMHEVFEPFLYQSMAAKNFPLIPYVNFFGGRPERGWSEFFDGPRYSTGYAALWNSFSFMPETHMLKPYDQRVRATYELMRSFIEFTSLHSTQIAQLRKEQKQQLLKAKEFPLAWKLNREKPGKIVFNGYESGMKTSEVSGLPRLYYDRSKPFTKTVDYFNQYEPSLVVKKPAAYILPQGWWTVAELLKLNGVEMRPLQQDTILQVEVYRIDDYQSAARPYEGHHPNSNVQVTAREEKMSFRKGDWYIPMTQAANRFLVEVLEPQGADSYFAWNFFDGILGRKEGFSAYAFEDIAAQYLKENPALRQQLSDKVASDTAFAKSASAQLDFVFKNSPYYEPDHLRYPVYRIKEQ